MALRIYGYESEFFEDGKRAIRSIENGTFIDASGKGEQFMLPTIEAIGAVGSSLMADKIEKRERRVMNDFMHYALKRDLVEHTWVRQVLM